MRMTSWTGSGRWGESWRTAGRVVAGAVCALMLMTTVADAQGTPRRRTRPARRPATGQAARPAARLGGQQGRVAAIPPAQLIADAATALGGRERLLSVRNLTIEGAGTNPNLGQQMRPETDLLVWYLPDYTRQIDLEHGRMRLAFTRRPAFPAVFDNARTIQGLDGDAAYNIPLPFGQPVPATLPAPVRASMAAAAERRVEWLHHPLTAVRAALDPASKLGVVRVTGAGAGATRTVDITTAAGDTVTLAVDAEGRPLSVSSHAYQANLGDVVRTTTFEGYEDVSGVRLPKHLITTLDRWVEFDVYVMKHTLDADLSALALPGAVRAAQPPPDAPPQNVIVTDVAKGIWFLTGSGVPSMVVEFADHVAIVEVPVSEARTLAVIAKARELVPGKPVTQAIVTHHHLDHTAGLRAAVSEGLTIVTHRLNVPWFREMVRRPHGRSDEALTRHPAPLKVTPVDDSLTLADPTMEVRLLHLQGSTHGDAILAVYFPASKVYAEPDVWNPGAQIQPHLRSLVADISRRGLAIERIVPLHGAVVQPFAEFEKVVRQWTGAGVPQP